MDCSLPGFSVHGTLQARILEWGAISFSIIESAILMGAVLEGCAFVLHSFSHEFIHSDEEV